MCQALLEIMKPENNKIKERITEAVTRQKERMESGGAAAALRDCGHGNEEIKSAIMEVYSISVGEAEEYL